MSKETQVLTSYICSKHSPDTNLLILLLKQEHLEQKLQFCTHLQKLIRCVLLRSLKYSFTIFFFFLGQKNPVEGANGKILKEFSLCGISGVSGKKKILQI